jgi:DNA processing protein
LRNGKALPGDAQTEKKEAVRVWGEDNGQTPMLDSRLSKDIPISDWLALERIPRVGPLSIARLVDAFGSPRAAMEADPKEITSRTGLSEKLARSIANFNPPKDEITQDLEVLESLSARVITRWDLEYPQNLQTIYDPPALLFVRGGFRDKDRDSVAIVGTRNPTRYGLETAQRIAGDLVRSGITVISGLARGIDTVSHKSSLDAGGRTIGVLGCGVNVAYPRENKPLIDEMAETGAVISEFRPGVVPHPTNFYRRNRIISGLAKGILVVEAAKNSGSLITANHAIDQNRDVFAVPGSIMNRRSEGPHSLLRQGAGLVESAEDILEALFHDRVSQSQPAMFDVVEATGDLTSDARAVLNSLDPDPIPIDMLREAAKMDTGKLLGLLLDLELRGLVRQYPGKMFARIVR